jgi:hypothetical protein
MMALARFLVIKAVSKMIVWTGWVLLLKFAPTLLLALFALFRPLSQAVGAMVMRFLPDEAAVIKDVFDKLSGGITWLARLHGPTAEAVARSFGIDGAVTGFIVGVACSLSIAGFLAYRERRSIARWFKKNQRVEPTLAPPAPRMPKGVPFAKVAKDTRRAE